MIGDVKTMSAVLIFDVLLLEFRHDAFGLIFQTQMALQFRKTISRSAMVELLNVFLFFPFAVVTKEKFTPRSKVLAQDLVQRPNLREALHIPHKTAQADSGHLQSIPLEKRDRCRSICLQMRCGLGLVQDWRKVRPDSRATQLWLTGSLTLAEASHQRTLWCFIHSKRAACCPLSAPRAQIYCRSKSSICIRLPSCTPSTCHFIFSAPSAQSPVYFILGRKY